VTRDTRSPVSEKTTFAATYHRRGYGCAQAVLASFAQDSGLEEETALCLSTGFGSGMVRMCDVCGALTRAFMVIGLGHGKVLTEGAKYGTGTGAELASRFKARNGSVYCRDLIWHDLSVPEERDKVRDQGLFVTTCGKCIREAVGLLEEVV
jgi:C_GCAxxG_C_C family probable redox protein